MKCEANNCTRKAARREDRGEFVGNLCDVHAEIHAFSPPAKRAPKPIAWGAWFSLIPLAHRLVQMAALFVTEGKKPRLGGQ